MNDLKNIKISSGKPCLIMFLIDQSGSMEEKWTNELGSKADCLANYINQIIREVGLKCVSNQEVKNRFEIGIIGYGKNDKVYSAFEGPLSFKNSKRWLFGIQDLFMKPFGYSPENGNPLWITPNAYHKTPMSEAFNTAKAIITDWVNWGNHYECHPPIIINITDGIPTDAGDGFELLIESADEIKNINTVYGNTMIFNCHIDQSTSDPILFPSNLQDIYDPYARVMFDISSGLMPKMLEEANRKGYNLTPNSKGLVYNAGPNDLIKFLQIGSSAA